MRFKLCTLQNIDNENQEEQTAYLKEDKAKVGTIVNNWKIAKVSVNSITEETLKNMRIIDVENIK